MRLRAGDGEGKAAACAGIDFASKGVWIVLEEIGHTTVE